MKIRIKGILDDGKEKFVYEIDDENGKKIEINASYLEATIKILNVASKKITIRNNTAFEKFITNIKRSTKYFDKMERKVVETPNIIHRKYDMEELAEYQKKHVKYEKKAQALFSLHNGWYENFISIAEEIEQVIEENYDLIKDSNENDKELLYVASRIDGILNNYRRKNKVKTL